MTGITDLTMGYDWEIFAVKHSGVILEEKIIRRVVNHLNAELPYVDAEQQDEWFEHKVGVCRSFPQLLERTEESLTRAAELFAEEEAMFVGSSTIPSQMWTTGCHLHVGTLREVAPTFRVRNELLRYMPAITALMANSPTYRDGWGAYKSCRVAYEAIEAANVQSLPNPEVCAGEWGADIAARLPSTTYECRVVDTPFSWRLACECNALLAAFASTLYGRHKALAPLTDRQIREYTENRLRAALHGLQATLVWDGEARSAVEVLEDMLGRAEGELARLRLEEPRLIGKCLATRRTQADLQLELLRCHACADEFVVALGRTSRRPEAFEAYLDGASTLPLVEPDDVAGYLLRHVDQDVPRLHLERLWPAIAETQDELFDGLARDGKIEATAGDGRVWFSRPGRNARRGAGAVTPPTWLEVNWPVTLLERSGAISAEGIRRRAAAHAAAHIPGAYSHGGWLPYVGIAAPEGCEQLTERLSAAWAGLERIASRDDRRVRLCGGDVLGRHVAPLMVLVPVASQGDGFRAFAHLQPLLPAFAALAANSHMPRLNGGPVKCARMVMWGWWWGSDALALAEAGRWAVGEEVGPPIHYIRDRLVLRMDTCDPSPNLGLNVTLVALLAALARAAMARDDAPPQPTRELQMELCANWLAAAYDALQATFVISGEERPVTDILGEALAEVEPHLAGVDLGLIKAMLGKRQTQADMQGALDEEGADVGLRDFRRAAADARTCSFADYLAIAPTLPSRPPRDPKRELRRAIRIEHPMWLPDALVLPLSFKEEALAEFERAGDVRVDFDERHGPLATDVALVSRGRG